MLGAFNDAQFSDKIEKAAQHARYRDMAEWANVALGKEGMTALFFPVPGSRRYAITRGLAKPATMSTIFETACVQASVAFVQ